MSFDLSGKRVWVAGHRGMVGSAVVRRLARENCEIITAGRDKADLKRQSAVEAFLKEARPDVVVMAAAKVGGILANDTYPVDFLYDNLMIEANIVEASHQVGVEKFLFLGSSCIYPKFAEQPIREDSLLTGSLEPTNEWYAIAKIAGLKMCAAYRRQYGSRFISAMPTNLYGAGDNYDLEHSHVVGALLVKTHRAKVARQPTIEIWGTGTPRREFLYVDDLADACVHLMESYEDEAALNVGVGSDVTILELAETIAKVVGWQGKFVLNRDRPDGTPRKLLDVSRLKALGWTAKTPLEDGIRLAYEAAPFYAERRAAHIEP